MRNSLKSSQLITPFGIGQIINFPKEISIMVCGLDKWEDQLSSSKRSDSNIDESDFVIIEKRLKKLLNVEKFIRPFPFKEKGKNARLYLPGVRFPQWHHCTNPRCGRMREIPLTQDGELICSVCGEKHRMIPVRFVAACSEGHIQDVPFKEWTHDGELNDTFEHHLSYRAGSGSGDLSSIIIKCSCGKAKSLAGLMNVSLAPDGTVYNSALASIGLNDKERSQIDSERPNSNNVKGQYCIGSQPWLGSDRMNCGCRNHLHVLIRGGSNVHFSNVISALYLPEFDINTSPAVGAIIDRLGIDELRMHYNQSEDHEIFKIILNTQPEIKDGRVSSVEAFTSIERLILDDKKLKNVSNNSENELRYEEYKFILKERNSENADFKSSSKSLDAYHNKEFLNHFFENVILIEKLKETRVYTGFSRINPRYISNSSQLSSRQITWLPANQIYGEGIFLQFKEVAINKWLQYVAKEKYKLIERYQQNIIRTNLRYEFGLNPVFVMMHTFAHLLIKRLCYNCGYGSSSLRERIYFDPRLDTQMNGILIYTSSGDSEGSMGGLVRQGNENYLGRLILDSIEDAKWCSADPVCSEIGQYSGQGPNNTNGSACHNCCLLPETSCEELNMLLDRALVVGTINNPELGFFNI